MPRTLSTHLRPGKALIRRPLRPSSPRSVSPTGRALCGCSTDSKSVLGASQAVEDLPGDGLRRAERMCARPPPAPSTFSPLLGGDPVAPVFCACSSPTCATACSPGPWTHIPFTHTPALCPQAFGETEMDRAAAAWSPRRRSVESVVGRAVREPGGTAGEQCSQNCSGGWAFRGTGGFPGWQGGRVVVRGRLQSSPRRCARMNPHTGRYAKLKPSKWVL